MRTTGIADTGAATMGKPISADIQVVGKEKVVVHGSKTKVVNAAPDIQQVQPLSNDEETKEKVQEIVEKMNKILEINNSFAKFVYHEGLDQYYLTVVNRDTEEVVKEIPPKRLLDAYYEMQKMFGMIVDEKI